MKHLKLWLALTAGVFALQSGAQIEYSAFSSTGRGIATSLVRDYHALGINPANLDYAPEYEGKYVTFGFFEGASSFYSEALRKDELRDNLFGEDLSQLTQEEKQDLALEFANSAMAFDIDIMTTGTAVRTNNIGGFGFSVRDRVDFNSIIGPDAADLMLLGRLSPYFEELVLTNGDTIPNVEDLDQETLDMVEQGIISLANAKTLTELLQGTNLSVSWIREFQFGYGKRIYSDEEWAIYGGVGFKYLMGNAMVQIVADDGEATAFSAVTPGFDIDYGDAEETNPSTLNEDGFVPVGNGFGLDFGLSFSYQNKFRMGASITDIGKMKWDGNVYKLKDTDFLDYDDPGIESLSLVDQIQTLTGADGFMEWDGLATHETTLPTQLRLGANWTINEVFDVGVDFVTRANDDVSNLNQAVIAVGGDITPVPWVTLSAGFINGGNYEFKIPAGVTFHVFNGTWEAGVASRDVITFFTEKQPTISASFGFLRFRV